MVCNPVLFQVLLLSSKGTWQLCVLTSISIKMFLNTVCDKLCGIYEEMLYCHFQT